MEEHITKTPPDRRGLDINPDTTLVGVRAMARYDQEMKYPLDKIHNYKIDFDHVQLAWFFARYRSIMQPQNRKSIEKIQPVFHSRKFLKGLNRRSDL